MRERQYRAITSLLIRAGDDTEDILALILHNAVRLLNSAAGYIGLFDEGGKTFYIHNGIGIDAALIRKPLPVEVGMKWQVYTSGEIFYVEDYRNYPGCLDDKRMDSSASSVIMTPLKQAGKVKGVLVLSWEDNIHPVNKEDLDALRQFGDLAVVALERDMINKQNNTLCFAAMSLLHFGLKKSS